MQGHIPDPIWERYSLVSTEKNHLERLAQRGPRLWHAPNEIRREEEPREARERTESRRKVSDAV